MPVLVAFWPVTRQGLTHGLAASQPTTHGLPEGGGEEAVMPFQSLIHARRTYRELRLLKHLKHENVERAGGRKGGGASAGPRSSDSRAPRSSGCWTFTPGHLLEDFSEV